MQSGKLRRRFTLAHITEGTQGPTGMVLQTPTSYATVWGRIVETFCDEHVVNNQLRPYTKYQITLRYRSDVLSTDCITNLETGHTYQIDGSPTPDEKHKQLTLTAIEITP
jgi:head-tail adaptor